MTLSTMLRSFADWLDSTVTRVEFDREVDNVHDLIRTLQKRVTALEAKPAPEIVTQDALPVLDMDEYLPDTEKVITPIDPLTATGEMRQAKAGRDPVPAEPAAELLDEERRA